MKGRAVILKYKGNILESIITQKELKQFMPTMVKNDLEVNIKIIVIYIKLEIPQN